MKKILVAFDGISFSKNSAAFAIRMAKTSNSLLVGVFLYDLRYAQLRQTYAWDIPYQFYYYDFSKIVADDAKIIKENCRVFTKLCEDAGVYFKIHLDKGVPLAELLKESPYADLIVIDAKTSFFKLGDQKMSTFLKDLLIESRCPVLIVPSKITDIKNVIVAYDGSESSVFAMKMFSYIFPEWSELNTTVVTVKPSPSNHLPKNRDIKDLASMHFKEIKYHVLHGREEDELINFLKDQKEQSIIVMGSYGRNALSRLFHASLSNKVINEVKVPLFIAHQ